VKAAPFDYVRPRSLEEALERLAQAGDEARPLAGGQSLIPLLAMRLARPALLVDLGSVAELRGARKEGDHWHIRAMTTQADLEATPGLPAAVEAALPEIAHFQIRSRGTVGGSLAHLDPAAEWPALILALGATLVVRSRSGSREVAAAEFIRGPMTTSLEADELLIEIRLPARPSRQAFAEVSRRPGDFALAGAVVNWPEAEAPSIAVFGVGPVAQRLRRLEAAVLSGLRPGRELRLMAENEVDVQGDIHAPPGYRRRLAGALIDRVVGTVCA
jgi:carbon-monoxide dehydrogenase medium subunit